MDQTIQNPHGISMFGSCVVHIEPDYCTIDFAVTRIAPKPSDASNATKQAANAVTAFLKSAGVETRDVRHSRVEIQISNPQYIAEIRFNLNVEDLDRVEPLLVGLLSAGVNDIRGIKYRSSRLRDARIEARQGAFLAALKKAEVISEAAGVKVGRTIHIEELEVDDIEALQELDDFQTSGSVNPNTVVIGAAVRVSFTIKGGQTAAATGQFVSFSP